MPINKRLNANSMIIGGTVPYSIYPTVPNPSLVYVSILPAFNDSIAKGIIFTIYGSIGDSATVTIGLTDNHDHVYKNSINSISCNITSFDTPLPISVPFKQHFEFKKNRTYFLLMQCSNMSSGNTISVLTFSGIGDYMFNIYRSITIH